MATILQHRRSGDRFILVSVNGVGNGVNPSRLLNELFTAEKSEVSCSVTLCDVEGNLFLANLDDLFVVEIEGVKPSDILPQPEPYNPQTPPSSYSYGEGTTYGRESDEQSSTRNLENEQKKEPQAPTRETQSANDLDESFDEDEDWI